MPIWQSSERHDLAAEFRLPNPLRQSSDSARLLGRVQTKIPAVFF